VSGETRRPARDPAREAITLEPQVAAHAEEMFAVLSDPAIYEYENDPPESLEALRERYRRLESRRSADGRELWLNWVVRLGDGPLIGYVQATVRPGGVAAIAYIFASAYWGRGFASRAVKALIGELGASHGVRELTAVFKRLNVRSRRLLERLGFELSDAKRAAAAGIGDDELMMERRL
jgi:RimJ/RimL family protein N-acetyltransferase